MVGKLFKDWNSPVELRTKTPRNWNVKRLDKVVTELGYNNYTEFVRECIRSYLGPEKMKWICSQEEEDG